MLSAFGDLCIGVFHCGLGGLVQPSFEECASIHIAADFRFQLTHRIILGLLFNFSFLFTVYCYILMTIGCISSHRLKLVTAVMNSNMGSMCQRVSC